MALLTSAPRTPLNAVIGFNSLVLEEGAAALGPTLAGYLRSSLTAAQALLGIITHVLEFSRLVSLDVGPGGAGAAAPTSRGPAAAGSSISSAAGGEERGPAIVFERRRFTFADMSADLVDICGPRAVSNEARCVVVASGTASRSRFCAALLWHGCPAA